MVIRTKRGRSRQARPDDIVDRRGYEVKKSTNPFRSLAYIAVGCCLAITLAALFLAYLRKGADLMSMRAGMQTDFVSVIQAVILVFLLAEQFLSGYRQRKTYALSKQLETAREEMGG